MHSTTKYLNGHSDSVGGVVVAVRDDDIEWLQVRAERRAARFSVRSIRGWCCAAPRRCRCGWRSTTRTAWRWREFLERASEGAASLLSGLPTHPQHDAREAADARIRRDALVRPRFARGGAAVLNSVRLMALAESLGGVETLISPSRDDDARVGAAERRQAIGITDGLVAFPPASRTSTT